ncbi:nuclear assembly factor 1 [Actinidia rufa]|uniref:H/ACA ribonucleoprotein complex non-core subunit NAF1 n=1 Tax=Actinidia rufa TaxID=165716 RepID=A0A7J0DRR8_9ERIC|nr:nuclear assembly factor 1 [Actinidia rufa]
MVGFLRDSTIEDELNQQQLKKSENPLPLDLSLPEFDDFSSSFADSFLDFDSIRDWVEENPVFDMADSTPETERVKDGSCGETEIGDGFWKFGNLNASIEEEIGKFSLDGGLDSLAMSVQPPSVCGNASKSVDIVGLDENVVKSGEMVIVDGGDLKSGETLGTDESGKKSGEIVANVEGQKSEEMENDEDECDSASDSDSSSSSLSPSSSSSEAEDDNEDEEEESEEEEKGEKELEGEIDMEEGEIRDSDVEKMVAWSDEDEDGGDGSITKGPNRSKNELHVLPPVPPVYVTLQPHHQTLPVGVILSILGPQVIVEGLEKHNPLNEGSILWITESRTPLGLVDEIFGPVKNPYYMIRYNSENEIPAWCQTRTLRSHLFRNSTASSNSSHSFGTGQGFVGSPSLVPPFPQLFQAPGFIPPSSGVWTNGVPCDHHQQQGMVFPVGVLTNGMPRLQQNPLQQSPQMPLPNGMPFQQQFVPSQMLRPNLVLPGGQSNFGAGTGFGPWRGGCLGPDSFNQPLGMGWQCQQAPMAMNLGEQPRPFNPDMMMFLLNLIRGIARGRGRKPYNKRGRGRFGGGRGQLQSK